MKFLDLEGWFIRKWNETFLLCSIIALSLDPLFFYIPIVDGKRKCIDVDHKLGIVVCILRSFADMLYVFHIIIQCRTAYGIHYDHKLGKRISRGEPHYVQTHYLTSSFIIDALAALPLPQLVYLVIIPKLDGPAPFFTEKLLKLIIFSQYIPRVIQISLFYKKVTKNSSFLTEKAWAGAAFNFFLYVLASHIVGALWYLFAIESQLRCWDIACQRHNCHSHYLYCGEGRVGDFGFLNTSCPLLERKEIKDSTDFDFGIFFDALQTRVLETRDFPQKIMYCSWWGFQSLSFLGQGLKASIFYGEILFADFIAIIRLVLFALFISNIQIYLLSFLNVALRVEEMKEKRQEEDPMSYISLPEDLKDRVRRQKHYKWKKNTVVELDFFIGDLPWDLRRDIKCHLYLPSVMRVPMFEVRDEHKMDAMYDCLKPVLYIENCYILREGDTVTKMLFITHGSLQSLTTDGGRKGFFNSTDLRAGDLCGEELLTWALDPETKIIRVSTGTVQTVTDVEAFAQVADNPRYYSQQWRTWAACFVQATWRRHHRKVEETLQEEVKELSDVTATSGEPLHPQHRCLHPFG